MRVFILCTGRTGSSTVARAFHHATNFTAAHESRIDLAAGRLDYPDDHIEADNRLSWFVGSLAKRYPDALYVHLTRDADEVVASYRRRFRDSWRPAGRKRSDVARAIRGQHRLSIVDGFAHSIVYRSEPWPAAEIDGVLRLFNDTVNDNIELLLRDHAHVRMDLADLEPGFREVWERIGAEGDLEAAVAELRVRHNATGAGPGA